MAGCGRCRACLASSSFLSSSPRALRAWRPSRAARPRVTSSSVSTSLASLMSSIGSSTSASSPSAASSRRKPRGLALGAGEHAAKALAAVDRDFHLDLDQMAGIAVEIGFAHQRPVDAGRGNFQPVGAVDRVGDVEHRRQRARHRLAVLDRHGAVRPLRHDLHGAAVGGRNLAPAPAGSRVCSSTGSAIAATRAGSARLDDQPRLASRRRRRRTASCRRLRLRPFW